MIIGLMPLPGFTVSIWAHMSVVSPGSVPGRNACTLKPLEPKPSPALSVFTSRPSAFRSATTFSHIAFSFFVSLSICTYPRKVSSSLFSFTIAVPLLNHIIYPACSHACHALSGQQTTSRSQRSVIFHPVYAFSLTRNSSNIEETRSKSYWAVLTAACFRYHCFNSWYVVEKEP